jgi:hypothetical protein
VKTDSLPDFEQASILAAIIALAFILAKAITLPIAAFDFAIWGLRLAGGINLQNVSAAVVAGLGAAGANWLIHERVGAEGVARAQYWILPGLTAWVMANLLFALPAGGLWWLVLALGMAVLALTWSAEYLVAAPGRITARFAVGGLTIQSLVLYLILAISLRAEETRLIFLVPALAVPAFLIVLRFLYLKLRMQELLDAENTTTAVIAAAAVGAGCGQLLTASHFLPLPAAGFGLASLAPLAAGLVLMANLVDGRSTRRAIWEPLIVLAGIWIAAASAG